MKRNPIDQFMKDPDNKAKLFVWITAKIGRASCRERV